MPSRESTELLEAMALTLARYEHERDRLRAQPAPPDDTTATNMRKIIDLLITEPAGMKRGQLMTDLGFDDGRAGRTAWDQLKARKLITDRTPFQVTDAGEDWYPEIFSKSDK